ncbi:MAG: RNA-guided pseudouridylation complex pseudouridine synthase subunit Cbf5 [Candidatus Pacearchaeota archaeon]|nr:RNA-guided pseudouridylation complex pseudouridine synthase subunit Cbf5 [Nanoarchaeota archaeon]MDZ4226594.1 RNA-guided pseudouridylation complex pseudouridine synthase subunit Cbf5 [Candidatus Pacearchaeota archaeon]
MIDIEKIKSKKTVKELLEFGIINIDKPSGPTSFDISDFVRKTLGLRKTSHFGTLDPKVTGVLPIALNRACKLTGFFLGEDKEYVGIMRIHEPVSLDDLKKAIKNFTGKIKQLPPVKSRVARVVREREIKSFEILEIDGQDILFKTEVQGGTYIRKLIHDMGESLGVGAHMLELRRIRAGIFKEDDEKYPSISLYELENAVKDEERLREIIIPGEVISKVYQEIQIKEESATRILRGQPIYNKDLVNAVKIEKDNLVSVFTMDKFIGMFRVVSEDEIFAKPEFVLQPI